MNFPGILKRKDPMDRALIDIEHDIDDLFKNEYKIALAADELREVADESAAEPDLEIEEVFAELATEGEAGAAGEPGRVTSHTRNRLAAYAMFDATRTAAFDEIAQIGKCLANLQATHHMGREFLNDCYSDIHRANDLEVSQAGLIAENRKLTQRVDNLERLRHRYDTLVEMLKKRENKLRQDHDGLRDALDALKFEMVDARNLISTVESKHGELHSALLAKTSQAEYATREAESVREKNANLAIDLDKVARQQTETRRQHEELLTVHQAEMVLFGETRARLATEERELERMRKAHDILEGHLADAMEALRKVELDSNEREKRFQAETHAVRGEIQGLNQRVQAGLSERIEIAGELAVARTRVADLEAERKAAEKRYAALTIEVEAERKQRREGVLGDRPFALVDWAGQVKDDKLAGTIRNDNEPAPQWTAVDRSSGDVQSE